MGLTAEELAKILYEEFDRDGWGTMDTWEFSVPETEQVGQDYEGLHAVMQRAADRINAKINADLRKTFRE